MFFGRKNLGFQFPFTKGEKWKDEEGKMVNLVIRIKKIDTNSKSVSSGVFTFSILQFYILCAERKAPFA